MTCDFKSTVSCFFKTTELIKFGGIEPKNT